jgi:hypothetical protein
MWVVAWTEHRQPVWAVRHHWTDAMTWALLMAHRWNCKARVVHTTRWP